MNLINNYTHVDTSLVRELVINDDGTLSITRANYAKSKDAGVDIYAKHLAGTLTLSIPYQSASKTTSYITVGAASQILTVNAAGNGYEWKSSSDLDVSQSNVITSTLTGRNLTTNWTVVEDLLAKLGSDTGSYLIQITYSARVYTGVFSYVSDGLNTNEEIILHMAGSDETVGGTKRGRLFAKIGCTSYVGNGGTTQYKLELYLSVDLAESNAQLTIKYKKLI